MQNNAKTKYKPICPPKTQTQIVPPHQTNNAKTVTPGNETKVTQKKPITVVISTKPAGPKSPKQGILSNFIATVKQNPTGTAAATTKTQAVKSVAGKEVSQQKFLPSTKYETIKQETPSGKTWSKISKFEPIPLQAGGPPVGFTGGAPGSKTSIPESKTAESGPSHSPSLKPSAPTALAQSPSKVSIDSETNERFKKLTDEKVAEAQKQKRQSTILCRNEKISAKCCGAIRAKVHHTDLLNKAQAVSGNIMFDKLGDLIDAKEINFKFEKCDFGHAMKKMNFSHLKGLMFNSASYGCTPEIVTKARQLLENEMQKNNVTWRFKTVPIRVRQTEYALAGVLKVDPDDLVIVPNANYGTSSVLKSQAWQPGDTFMVFSCDYEATLNACEYLRLTHAVNIEVVNMQLPASKNEILNRVKLSLKTLKGSNKLPVLANFCHVTSKTAFLFPAKQLVKLFHKYGVSTLVDGAQAAGHIKLNVSEIASDYYVGTMHKWMYTSPSVGFLVVDPTKQDLIEPLIVSYFKNTNFTKRFSYTGHMDFTAYITAQYALNFIDKVCGGLPNVQNYLHKLAKKVVHLLTSKWRTRCCQKWSKCYGSMPIIELPNSIGTPTALHAGALMLALLEQHDMTTFIFVHEFFGKKLMVIRVACQIYHELSDFERLADAISGLQIDNFLTNRMEDVTNFLTSPFF